MKLIDKIKKSQVLFLLFITSFLPLASIGYSHAATTGSPNGFTISPVITEVTINKGASYTVPITIQNPTAVTSTAVGIVNDFVASANENGEPSIIVNESAPLPANNFKSLVGTVPSVTLSPNEQKTINVTLSVPQGANPGGYYGTIRFAAQSSGSPQGNIGLTASVGTLFLVTVPGNLTEKINIAQLSAANSAGTPRSFFSSGAVSVISRLQNAGNIHTQPFGSFEIKNMFGHIVTTGQVNNTTPRANVLPNSIRKFVNPLPSNLHLLGYYTITETITYGTGGGNILIAKASFWYIPNWLLILLIIVVVLIVVLAYTMFRKMKHRSGHKIR